MKKTKKIMQILLCPLIIFCLIPINITAVTTANKKITPMIETYSDYTAGLTDEGKILITGEDSEKKQKAVDDLTEVIQISISGLGLAALKSDGTVSIKMWYNQYDYVQSDAENWSNIVQISMDEFYVIGLKSDGTVVSTKPPTSYDFGQSEVSDWEDIVQVSTNYYTTVGLKSDGTVIYVGEYYYDTDISTWTDIVQIKTSEGIIVGLKSDGTLVTALGQPPQEPECQPEENYFSPNWHFKDLYTWMDIVSFDVSGIHIIGVKKDGSVVIDGYGYCCETYNCYEIEKWTDIISITATTIYENMRYMGLKSDGKIVCWVGNAFYPLDGFEDWDLISEDPVGDLDGDKAVGITDLVTMAKFVHNRVPLTEKTFSAADLNADNTVNAIDLSILKWLMMKG
jgi:hypothetical protein